EVDELEMVAEVLHQGAGLHPGVLFDTVDSDEAGAEDAADHSGVGQVHAVVAAGEAAKPGEATGGVAGLAPDIPDNQHQGPGKHRHGDSRAAVKFTPEG